MVGSGVHVGWGVGDGVSVGAIVEVAVGDGVMVLVAAAGRVGVSLDELVPVIDITLDVTAVVGVASGCELAHPPTINPTNSKLVALSIIGWEPPCADVVLYETQLYRLAAYCSCRDRFLVNVIGLNSFSSRQKLIQ
jgi:hypothetical protein